MKITPVLLVEEIEPSLPFWIDRMGFAKVAEVPDGDRLRFAILTRDAAELMLQTVESAGKDQPGLLPKAGQHVSTLFIEVADWEDARKRIEGYPIAMAERVTFYGMREVGVFEPGGHAVIFAAPIAGKEGG